MEIEVAEPGLANAHCIGQHGLEHRLKLARRTGDYAQHLRGGGLPLQRRGKMLPSLDEFVPVFFELLFQISTRLTHPTNARSHLRCLRTKTGNASSALRPF